MLGKLKSFIPFWDFFNGLPTKYQLGYIALVFVLIFYTSLEIRKSYRLKPLSIQPVDIASAV
jgi:hypothetical protein